MSKSTPVQKRNAYIRLHISVLLWGFTALLGKLISVRALPLVWYRVLITSVSLLLIPGIIPAIRRTPTRRLWQLAGIGCITCLHWVAFYASVKVGTISLALVSLATTGFFVSLIEPIIMRRPFRVAELLLGLLIVPGVYLLQRAEVSQMGLIYGLLAAMLAALFSTLNKKVIPHHEPRMMTFVQLGSGTIFLSLVLLGMWLAGEKPEMALQGHDYLWLLLMALGCTTLPYVLALRALKHIDAFASALTINLETLYGVILGILVFPDTEVLELPFYMGATIILTTVFLHPFISRFTRKSRLTPPTP